MRIKLITTALALGLGLGTSVWADALRDAEYIVSQTVSQDAFANSFTTQVPLVAQAMDAKLASLGVEIVDKQGLGLALYKSMITKYTERMQDETVQFYLSHFTEAHLAEIAAFYRSDAGQAMIGSVPALSAFGATKGQLVGQMIGASLGPDLADLIEADGLVLTADASGTPALLDALRTDE